MPIPATRPEHTTRRTDAAPGAGLSAIAETAAGLSENHCRHLFISLVCVLAGFGILMVHSASITSWPTEFEQIYLSRHLTFLALGAVLAAIASRVPPGWWPRAAPWLLAGTLLLLVLVLVPGVGTRVNGARRWLRYGPASLQPSELLKIALPLLLCRLIAARRHTFGRWSFGSFLLLWPLALCLPLVLLQPDFGTTVFLLLGVAIALFAGGWPLRNFALGVGLAIPLATWMVMRHPYQLRRITGFLAAWRDLDEAPWQIQQSLISLGAGGLTGSGLGRGWQKLSFLPEANTDFVFAVVGEELGLVGTLSLIGVWLGLYLAGLRLLRPLPRGEFAWLAGFTLLTQLLLQAGINVAVVTALLPPKGIPHPLLSYGGTNLVVSLVSIGILLSLTAPGHHPPPRTAAAMPSHSPSVMPPEAVGPDAV